jgi:hypothetical protein
MVTRGLWNGHAISIVNERKKNITEMDGLCWRWEESARLWTPASRKGQNPQTPLTESLDPPCDVSWDRPSCTSLCRHSPVTVRVASRTSLCSVCQGGSTRPWPGLVSVLPTPLPSSHHTNRNLYWGHR